MIQAFLLPLLGELLIPKARAAIDAGGKVGQAVASAVVDKLEEVTGIKVTDAAAAAQAAEAVKADPQLALQFFQAQAEALTQLLVLDNEDRANARAREIALRDNTPRNLAYFMTGLVALIALVAMFRGMPQDTLTAQIIVTIVGGWLAAITYYFGSSAGSKAKDQLSAISSSRGA